MAPEVARGEEQGPAADVWALGCTVVELATGRAPWSCADCDALAALHRIGYTDAVPEVPQWLSAEAKDFLAMCFVRRASDRCTAAQLLEHPFLAFAAGCNAKLEDVNNKWVSPKSTLDAAFWESESDNEESDDEISNSSAERINALSCPASALPDWDSDEGWIDVLSGAPTEPQDAVAVPVEETACLDDAVASDETTAETAVLRISSVSGVPSAGVAEHDSVVGGNMDHQSLEISVCDELAPCKLQFWNRSMKNAVDFVLAQTLFFLLLLCFSAHSSSRPHCDTSHSCVSHV
jgi:serine/threonine protein kinase